MSAGVGRIKAVRLACIALGASVLFPVLVIACGDDAEPSTPECPDLPLFNIRELEKDGGSQEAKDAFEKWKAEGASGNTRCVTGPGTATIPDATFTGG
jgi:hypothetical protein